MGLPIFLLKVISAIRRQRCKAHAPAPTFHWTVSIGMIPRLRSGRRPCQKKIRISLNLGWKFSIILNKLNNRIQNTGHRRQNGRFAIRYPLSAMRNTQYAIRDTGCSILDTQYAIRNIGGDSALLCVLSGPGGKWKNKPNLRCSFEFIRGLKPYKLPQKCT